MANYKKKPLAVSFIFLGLCGYTWAINLLSEEIPHFELYISFITLFISLFIRTFSEKPIEGNLKVGVLIADVAAVISMYVGLATICFYRENIIITLYVLFVLYVLAAVAFLREL